MQQECSLTLSSSEQHEKSFFCHEQICQDDSGDEVTQKYVPTVLPDQNEIITMEEGSSYSSPSHYASPPLTSVYGSLTPMKQQQQSYTHGYFPLSIPLHSTTSIFLPLILLSWACYLIPLPSWECYTVLLLPIFGLQLF